MPSHNSDGKSPIANVWRAGSSDQQPYRWIRLRFAGDIIAAWFNACRDARAGLPNYEKEIVRTPATTSYLAERERRLHEVAQRENLLMVEDTAEAAVLYRDLVEQQRQLKERIDLLVEELDVLEPPTERQLGSAHGIEAQLDPAIVRQRRVREHRRLREAIEAKLRAHRDRYAEVEKKRARTHEEMTRRVRVAQRRADRYAEFTRRCCARYSRTLVRRHAEGSSLLDSGWPLMAEPPAWVGEADSLRVVQIALEAAPPHSGAV